MFSIYEIKKINNKEYLFLHINNNYEFSKEFLKNEKTKKRTIHSEVINFIKERKITFNGKKVFLILNGILIGTIILHNIVNPVELKSNNFQYAHYDNTYFEYNKDDYIKDNPLESTEDEKKDTNITDKNQNSNNQTNIITKPKINTNTPPIENNTPKQETIVERPKEEIKQGIMVTLHRYNGTIEQIALEEYVIGVVAAEMPALFHTEALKAQSLAARTYVLKRMAENKIITDSNTHQAYKDETQLKTTWATNYDAYYNKIKNAVNNTKGEYIAYNNYYIDALYHSTSNGKTEDPIYVWGGSFPYLKSVSSYWDLKATTYEKTNSKTFEEATKLLGFNFDENINIQIVSKTTGDRIDKITIGENTYSGVDIRTLFGLRSSDFDIEITNGRINFTTRGYGHGVGMSQYGANGMAKEGYTYRQIINHYYPNTKVLNK